MAFAPWTLRFQMRVLNALVNAPVSDDGEPLYTLWNDVDWHYTSNAYLIETGVA